MREELGIGAALSEIRKAKRLKQREVAERAGISSSWASRMEGKASNPRFSSLLRYLRAADSSLAELHEAMNDAELSSDKGGRSRIGQPLDRASAEIAKGLAELLSDQERRIRRLEESIK